MKPLLVAIAVFSAFTGILGVINVIDAPGPWGFVSSVAAVLWLHLVRDHA